MLTVEGLVKSYGPGRRSRALQRQRSRAGEQSENAVDGVTFEVQEGELFTLLGPSGCGKTTTLRSIAGLERPDAGVIRLRDTVLYDHGERVNLPANRRGLGMVFQSYAIWPHMTVFRNVSFPLEVLPRRRRLGRTELGERVRRVLEVVGLAELADRQATKLSGGQQQRLALARALVTEPQLLLLDEPLSNLDAKLREAMRFELKRLQRELGLTAVYVTHDQAEALVLSSKVAVMRAGRIVQVGKPREIYTRPRNQFVAEFIGVSNFVQGTTASVSDGCVRVETSEGALWTTDGTGLQAGTEVLLSIRPESLEVSTDSRAPTARNEWRGSVLTRAFLGDSTDHVVGVGKYRLRVRSNPTVSIEPGREVYLRVDPSNVVIVPAEG
jgi:iron(III) transport system ATP-binding protein